MQAAAAAAPRQAGRQTGTQAGKHALDEWEFVWRWSGRERGSRLLATWIVQGGHGTGGFAADNTAAAAAARFRVILL